ncbi:hypothetical protein Dimus_022463 [Dionaea muscipula]
MGFVGVTAFQGTVELTGSKVVSATATPGPAPLRPPATWNRCPLRGFSSESFQGVSPPFKQETKETQTVRRSGGGYPEVGAASRFALLSELDEDSVEDEYGDRGDSDREGHRLASCCVEALFDASEVIGDGRETAIGGKMKGRKRGGRRGGSTCGRGGRSRGRGPS